MGLKADRNALAKAAAGWGGVSNELARALALLPGDQPRGEAFGYHGRSSGVAVEHDKFIRAMVDALDQGVRSTRILALALRETAQDFGATDAAVADEFHTPEGAPTR